MTIEESRTYEDVPQTSYDTLPLKTVQALLFVIALGQMIFGGVIFFGNIIYGVLAIYGTVEVPVYLSAFLFQGFLALVIGFITLQIFNTVSDGESQGFSWSFYLGLIQIVLYLTIPGVVGYLFQGLSALLILLIWLPPQVRHLWLDEFLEDMRPRMKETRYSIYLIRKSPLVVAGIFIIVGFTAIAILAPYITPYGPEERIWEDARDPPGPDHIWGADDNGGDIYSRIIWGAQVDLRIAVQVVLVAVIIGTFLGAASGYYGGKLDEIVMRVTDIFFAFPGLVLAMAIVMALGERSLDNISVALMITWWPTYARLVRGQVLSEREKLYVEAARSVGASDTRILVFHIIPNTIQPLIVQSTMDIGGVLLTAAGLSYIGFGPPAGVAEWGLMISQGQQYLLAQPWMSLYPGIAILVTALAFNLVGDGIRDIMDPKLRRR
ncbi:MAG: ABC transporter permease [Candidatus Thorarchaeota archaeon]